MSDTYEVNNLVIHGSVSNAIQRGYVNPIGWGHTSHDGDPAFCMYLKVTGFERQSDRSVKFTIASASLNKLISGYFGYEFQISAAVILSKHAPPEGDPYNDVIYSDDEVVSKTLLFTKPAGETTWNSGIYEATDINILIPDPKDRYVKFVIYNYSSCTCDQKDVNVPVFLISFVEYVPPEIKYIWRMGHGASGTQPLGWHLVRPFYVLHNGRWVSVEELK